MRHLIFALLFAISSPAAAGARCGTDDFGNSVCMDKDGVVDTVPTGRTDNDGQRKATAAGSVAEPGNKGGDAGKSARPRCGIDPFGNKVCR